MISNIVGPYLTRVQNVTNEKSTKRLLLQLFSYFLIYAVLLFVLVYFSRETINFETKRLLAGEAEEWQGFSDSLMFQMVYFIALLTSSFFFVFFTGVMSVILYSTASVYKSNKIKGSTFTKGIRFYTMFIGLLVRLFLFLAILVLIAFLISRFLHFYFVLLIPIVIFFVYVSIFLYLRKQTDLSNARTHVSVTLTLISMAFIIWNVF